MKLNTQDVSLLTKEQFLAIIDLLTRVIAQQPPDEEILKMIVKLASDLTFSSGAVVEKLEDNDMVYTCVSGIIKGKEGMRINAHNSLSGLCLKEGRILTCQDSETDERVDRQACRVVGLRSMMVVPLMRGTTPFGVLKVFSPKPRAFDEIDEQILKVSAKIISDSILSSRVD